MAGRLLTLAQASISTVGVWLLCSLGFQGTETALPSAPPELPGGSDCLTRFTSGVPAFVLDTEASVSNGATFLGSPTVRRGWDCVRACCATQNCNLALVELQPDGGEDAISACFLMNCLYEQNFVCKFAPKEGFINYLTQELYHSYRELRTRGFGGSQIPRTWVGIDLKVQLQKPLVLRDPNTTNWHLLQGDSDVRVERNSPDEVELWGLKEGTYVFQLTRTDSDQPEDTANLTITVLTAKQTEDYCLASYKVGRCRGSFPRWYYDPTEQICKSFTYGGCLGNKNNYLREEECMLACKDVQGFCAELPDTGPCQENIPRWYYNPFSEHCARFTYGGCYGNKNSFEEEQQCLESCRGISKKDVFGLRRESSVPSVGSVEVAIAVLLVISIIVVVAILGYFFFKSKRKGFRSRRHHPPPTPASSTVSTTEDTERLVYNRTTRPL
ncbi:Kunitz-type protease inhibitor 1 [Lemmus lemmus]